MNGLDNGGFGSVRPVRPVDRIVPLEESPTKERLKGRRKGCKKGSGTLSEPCYECSCGRDKDAGKDNR